MVLVKRKSQTTPYHPKPPINKEAETGSKPWEKRLETPQFAIASLKPLPGSCCNDGLPAFMPFVEKVGTQYLCSLGVMESGISTFLSQVPVPEKALPFSVPSASYWTTRSMFQTRLPQLSSGTHFSLQHKTCVLVSQGVASTTPSVPEAGSGIFAKQTLAHVSDNFPEVSLHRISENAFVLLAWPISTSGKMTVVQPHRVVALSSPLSTHSSGFQVLANTQGPSRRGNGGPSFSPAIQS